MVSSLSMLLSMVISSPSHRRRHLGPLLLGLRLGSTLAAHRQDEAASAAGVLTLADLEGGVHTLAEAASAAGVLADEVVGTMIRENAGGTNTSRIIGRAGATGDDEQHNNSIFIYRCVY